MPSKTIEDFAYQVRDYMRSAEIVPSKNLFDNQLVNTTEGNVTFTKNADKSVSTSGTSNADWVTVVLNSAQFLKAGDYTISGIEDGSQETYRFFVAGSHIEVSGSSVSDFVLYGGSKNFTVTQDSTVSVSVIVRYSGVDMTGKTFYPMITDASETDQTYMPYFEPVKDSKLDIKDQQVLGAWNLAKNTGSATSSIYDVDFTKNSDDSITADGTNDGTNSSTYVINASLPLKAGTYYLSGGVSANAGLQVYKSTSPYTNYGKSEGSEVTVTIPEDTNVTIIAYVAKNATVSNVVLKPMISLEPNQPYVPNAMTNSELTDAVTPEDGTITAYTGVGITLNTTWTNCKKIGNLVIANARFTVGNSDITSGKILTLPYTCVNQGSIEGITRQANGVPVLFNTVANDKNVHLTGRNNLLANTEYILSFVYVTND